MGRLNTFNATEGELQRSVEEAVRLCETILEECKEDNVRHQAIRLLSLHYSSLGRHAEAESLAYSLPEIDLSKEPLLERIYTGDAKVKHTKRNLLKFVDMASNSLVRLAFDKEMGNGLSHHEKIEHILAANRLYEIIISDGNYLYYHCRLAWDRSVKCCFFE